MSAVAHAAVAQEARPSVGAPRFLALDVFRGATVALMIVVNSPGAGAEPYAWLEHARWFGFTAADLVFPSFLFAVGSSMSFALRRPVTDRAFLLKVARRAALIFLLGAMMFWWPFVHWSPEGRLVASPLADVRIMGVLQRIALCFALAALAARYVPERRLVPLCGALLLGYWAVLLAFGEPGAQLTPLGNAAARLDRAVLGLPHMYKRGHGYDPEGLLGTLPAVVNVLAGYLAGQHLFRSGDKRRAAVALALAGVASALAGLAWSPVFPLAKRIWTSSFVLLATGIDLMILAALVGYLDVAGRRRGARFFEVFGKNPLAVYLFSEVLLQTLSVVRLGSGLDPYGYVGVHLFQALAPGPLGSLACAIAFMLVCWLFGHALDRRGVVVKI